MILLRSLAKKVASHVAAPRQSRFHRCWYDPTRGTATLTRHITHRSSEPNGPYPPTERIADPHTRASVNQLARSIDRLAALLDPPQPDAVPTRTITLLSPRVEERTGRLRLFERRLSFRGGRLVDVSVEQPSRTVEVGSGTGGSTTTVTHEVTEHLYPMPLTWLDPQP